MSGGGTWFLKSMGDRDTHRGRYSIATRSVHAVCGREFEPMRRTTGEPITLASPPDPAQVCPDCRRIPRRRPINPGQGNRQAALLATEPPGRKAGCTEFDQLLGYETIVR